MSNRRDRRRAAAIHRSAKPMAKSDRRQLASRIAITVAAAAGAILLIMLVRGG